MFCKKDPILTTFWPFLGIIENSPILAKCPFFLGESNILDSIPIFHSKPKSEIVEKSGSLVDIENYWHYINIILIQHVDMWISNIIDINVNNPPACEYHSHHLQLESSHHKQIDLSLAEW